MKKDLYSCSEDFLNRLIYDNINSERAYSHFISVLKSDYIGFDIPKASGTDGMKGLKKRFEEIVRELDRENQIEKIFTHYKEGSKRPTWEVSAVNAKAFYKEINEMHPIRTLDCQAATSLYHRYCDGDGGQTSYERIKKLIECFTWKADCGGWYEEYKRLDKMAKILCDLVPMVYYGEDGDRQIKTYSRWREDCKKIIQIVHEKTLSLGIDQVELKAEELVASHINKISENGYEKEVQACFKERYLDFLTEQSEKFFQAADKVYWILKNVDKEKDRAEIAKRALDSLDIK